MIVKKQSISINPNYIDYVNIVGFHPRWSLTAIDIEVIPTLHVRFRVKMDVNTLVGLVGKDRKSTRLNSSHVKRPRMPSSA